MLYESLEDVDGTPDHIHFIQLELSESLSQFPSLAKELNIKFIED